MEIIEFPSLNRNMPKYQDPNQTKLIKNSLFEPFIEKFIFSANLVEFRLSKLDKNIDTCYNVSINCDSCGVTITAGYHYEKNDQINRCDAFKNSFDEGCQH